MVKLGRILKPSEFRDDAAAVTTTPRRSSSSKRGRRTIFTYSNKYHSADAPTGAVSAAVGAIERRTPSPDNTSNIDNNGLLSILQNQVGVAAAAAAALQQSQGGDNTYRPSAQDEQRDDPPVIDLAHAHALTRAAQMAAQKSNVNYQGPPLPGASKEEEEEDHPADEREEPEKEPEQSITMAMLDNAGKTSEDDPVFMDALRDMMEDEEDEKKNKKKEEDKEHKEQEPIAARTLQDTFQKCAPDLVGDPAATIQVAALPAPGAAAPVTPVTVDTCLDADNAVKVVTIPVIHDVSNLNGIQALFVDTTDNNTNNEVKAKDINTPKSINADTKTRNNDDDDNNQNKKIQTSTSQQDNETSGRSLFKNRRGGRKTKAERRKAEKAAKRMAQEAMKIATRVAEEMTPAPRPTTSMSNASGTCTPSEVIDLAGITTARGAELESAELAAAEQSALVRTAVARKMQEAVDEALSGHDPIVLEEPDDEEAPAAPGAHKNKYKHIARVEPEMRSIASRSTVEDDDHDFQGTTFEGTLSGSASGSFYSSDGRNESGDSYCDTDDDDDAVDEKNKLVLDAPKIDCTLFELESKLSGSTCSSSSLSTNSSMMSDDCSGSLETSDEDDDSGVDDDDEDSLVDTIVGVGTDTIMVGQDDTMCDDANITLASTDDDVFLTDEGEGDTDDYESSDNESDESEASDNDDEHGDLFASFCQRPEVASFDQDYDANYEENQKRKGKSSRKQRRAAAAEGLPTLLPVPSLLKCVSGYFAADEPEEPRRHRLRSRRHRS